MFGKWIGRTQEDEIPQDTIDGIGTKCFICRETIKSFKQGMGIAVFLQRKKIKKFAHANCFDDEVHLIKDD